MDQSYCDSNFSRSKYNPHHRHNTITSFDKKHRDNDDFLHKCIADIKSIVEALHPRGSPSENIIGQAESMCRRLYHKQVLEKEEGSRSKCGKRSTLAVSCVFYVFWASNIFYQSETLSKHLPVSPREKPRTVKSGQTRKFLKDHGYMTADNVLIKNVL